MILFRMTEWQKKVVEAVIEKGSYAKAAQFLGVEYGAVRAVFSKLRAKDRDATEFHSQILIYQKRLGPKKRYLTT